MAKKAEARRWYTRPRETASARILSRSRNSRMMPRHVLNPCSGCRRLARMAIINPSVFAPTEARPSDGTVLVSIRRSAGARWAYAQDLCRGAHRHNGAHARQSGCLGKISRSSAPSRGCRLGCGSGYAAPSRNIRRPRHDNPVRRGPGPIRQIHSLHLATQPKLDAQWFQTDAAG